METWTVLAWISTTLIAIGGTWVAAFFTYKAKAGDTAVQQWIELVKAVQTENKRYLEKQVQLEERIQSLENLVEKWERDFRQLDNQNAALAQTLKSVERDKEEQQERHREIIKGLQKELQGEREINGSFSRMVDEQRLLTEHYARTNRRLASMLHDRCNISSEEIELFLREQIN